MTIAYFRRTERSVDAAVAAAKEGLRKRNLALTGEKKLPSGSVLLQFFDEKSAGAILAEDRMLLGLIPAAILVEANGKEVSVGIVNPQILMGTPRLAALEKTIEGVIEGMRGLVNEAAGVGDPKVEAIKLYSTATCPYCRMEKDYLEKNGIKFDLVMVDADRKAAEEMVRKSGQTGVPQTEVAYDDGDTEIIMGFDKVLLNQLLGIGK
jgi:glutaredoxin 3